MHRPWFETPYGPNNAYLGHKKTLRYIRANLSVMDRIFRKRPQSTQLGETTRPFSTGSESYRSVKITTHIYGAAHGK